MTNQKKARLIRFGHLLAGFDILLHGWSAYQKGHHTAWMFMLLGSIFLLIAIFHHRIAKRFPRVDGIFYIIEAMALSAVMYDYFHEKKQYLPWLMMIGAAIYLVLGFLILSGVKKTKHHH